MSAKQSDPHDIFDKHRPGDEDKHQQGKEVREYPGEHFWCIGVFGVCKKERSPGVVEHPHNKHHQHAESIVRCVNSNRLVVRHRLQNGSVDDLNCDSRETGRDIRKTESEHLFIQLPRDAKGELR